MKGCHACGALQPLEAVLCQECDAYIGTGRAVMGQGPSITTGRSEAAVNGRGWTVMDGGTGSQLQMDAGGATLGERERGAEAGMLDVVGVLRSLKAGSGSAPKKPGGTVVRVGYEVHWRLHSRSRFAEVRALGEDWRLSVGLKYWMVCRKVMIRMLNKKPEPGLYMVRQGLTGKDAVAGQAMAEKALAEHLDTLMNERAKRT